MKVPGTLHTDLLANAAVERYTMNDIVMVARSLTYFSVASGGMLNTKMPLAIHRWT